MTTNSTQQKAAPAAPVGSGRVQRELGALASVPFRLRFVAWLAGFLPDFAMANVRARLYRRAGFGIDSHVSLLGRLNMIGEGDYASRLTIKEGSIIAPNVTFGLDAAITIGKNVSISPGATVYTATHAIGFGSRRMSLSVTPRPITVGDGAWIGMNALVLPGVTLGQGCVVAAGAVVTADVPANTLVAGNPATVQQALPFGNR